MRRPWTFRKRGNSFAGGGIGKRLQLGRTSLERKSQKTEAPIARARSHATASNRGSMRRKKGEIHLGGEEGGNEREKKITKGNLHKKKNPKI